MIDKITKEDLAIFEILCNPISCAEIMFSDLGHLSQFEEEKFGEVRKCQYPMLSFESMFFENSKKKKKENFKIKKGLGDCLNFGGRLTGKSWIGIIVDVCLSVWHEVCNWGIISSCDATKIRGIMETIIPIFENHPILKSLGIKSKAHPAYLLKFKNGIKIESVNNNVAGKNPGKNWFQKHADKNWEEEGSFLTDSISNKKLMAQSEMGMVERLTGMTNFKKASPIGRKFFDIKNENIIINLPSYANPTWDDEKDEAAEKEFGGKQSPGYRTQIRGEIVDDGESVYDIERIRLCYKRNKEGDPILIKSFEINKNNFHRHQGILILDRPANVERVWIAIDKGEGAAPTEIIVLFEIKGIYKYELNITTYKLSPDEDNEIVDYVISNLQANIVGLDVTSGGGKAMFSYLAKKYNKPEDEHIFGVNFGKKIPIDFERDSKTNEIKRDNKGNPIYREEYIVDWSIQRNKHLFYNKKILALFDSKLDNQFDNEVVLRSDKRIVYGNKGADHLHQAFQVFGICQWNYEFKNIKPIKKKKPWQEIAV